jgi:hypothetical protein
MRTIAETATELLQQTYQLLFSEYNATTAEPTPTTDNALQAARRHRLTVLRLLAGTARELSALARAVQPKPERPARAAKPAPEPAAMAQAFGSTKAFANETDAPAPEVPPEADAPAPEADAPAAEVPPEADAPAPEVPPEADAPTPEVPPETDAPAPAPDAPAPDVQAPAPEVPLWRTRPEYTPDDLRRVPEDELRASIPPEFWANRPTVSLNIALQTLVRWRKGELRIPGLGPYAEYASNAV